MSVPAGVGFFSRVGSLSRRDEPEWMDTRLYPPEVVRQTLDFLGVTIRWFGGARVVLRRFETWSRTWPAGRRIRVLDVGTGGGELPIEIVRWARRTGRSVAATAIDLVPEIAAVAAEKTRPYPEITVRAADVTEIARSGETFDYVTASLLLHHIPPAKGIEILRTLDAVAVRGLVISDLRRTYAGLLGVSALCYAIGNRVVRHDGPLSVRRAFRAPELAALAHQAGLPYLTARNERFFRVSLSGEKRRA